MKKETFSYEKRTYEALQVSQDQLKQLINDLTSNLDLEYVEEYSKAAGRSIYELIGHGREPLGLVQSYLTRACQWDGRHLPADVGYDTDADGVGYNGIFLVTN